MSSTATNVTLVLPDGYLTDSAVSPAAALQTSKLEQRVLQPFPVSLEECRVWDAPTSLPVSTAANDDLALIVGTFGTDALLLSAGDLKAAGAVTRMIRFAVKVPQNYDDGATIQLRVRAAVETTVADTSCTVDLSAYTGDGAGAVGSDLITTSAASMNSVTPANYDFVLNGASIDPGDVLEVRLAIACNDAATGTAVTPVVYAVTLLCDTRG